MFVAYHCRGADASAKAGRGNHRIFRNLRMIPQDASLNRTPMFASCSVFHAGLQLPVADENVQKMHIAFMDDLLFAVVLSSKFQNGTHALV
jgi:hypothetical protein